MSGRSRPGRVGVLCAETRSGHWFEFDPAAWTVRSTPPGRSSRRPGPWFFYTSASVFPGMPVLVTRARPVTRRPWPRRLVVGNTEPVTDVRWVPGPAGLGPAIDAAAAEMVLAGVHPALAGALAAPRTKPTRKARICSRLWPSTAVSRRPHGVCLSARWRYWGRVAARESAGPTVRAGTTCSGALGGTADGQTRYADGTNAEIALEASHGSGQAYRRRSWHHAGPVRARPREGPQHY